MEWHKAVSDYRHYLRIERGLSDNTLINYTFDLEKLISYLLSNGICASPEKISQEHLQDIIYSIQAYLLLEKLF